MKENTEENNQKKTSNFTAKLFIVIIIVGTALTLTPLGDLLNEKVSSYEFIDDFKDKEQSKENAEITDNKRKKVNFTYTIQYNHLGTENNILLDGTVFFYFPIPMIENNPAVNLGPDNHEIENNTVQLLANTEENGNRITHVQIKDGDYGKLIDPRQEALFSENPFISKLENHGKKITVQSSGGGFTEAFRKSGIGGAIYKHESILIKIKFSVPKEKKGKISLKDKKGIISSQISGTTDGPNTNHTHIPIKYSVLLTLTQETEEGQKVKKFRFKAEEPIHKDKSVELEKID